MGQEYLIDSNVIIDYTSERIPSKGSDFVEGIFERQFLVSVTKGTYAKKRGKILF